MRIRLSGYYSGVPSMHRTIPPGEYDRTDERLLGLADYLLQTGQAERLEDEDSVEDMTLKELKALAEERGLDTDGLRTKADFIAALTDDSPALEPPPAE
jgi:hypothetical protein